MAKNIIIATADIYAIGYSQTEGGSQVPEKWWLLFIGQLARTNLRYAIL